MVVLRNAVALGEISVVSGTAEWSSSRNPVRKDPPFLGNLYDKDPLYYVLLAVERSSPPDKKPTTMPSAPRAR
jgi:hypothetical protein